MWICVLHLLVENCFFFSNSDGVPDALRAAVYVNLLIDHEHSHFGHHKIGTSFEHVFIN